MKRLYEPRAYDTSVWPDSHWRQVTAEPRGALDHDAETEAVVIGAGYAGLSAAIALARAGTGVTVLDAGQPGWGASGRNGGFCCMGGSKLSDAELVKRFGREEAIAFRAFQKQAVDHVAATLETEAIDAEAGPAGEVCLAHSARAWSEMQDDAAVKRALYGDAPDLFPREALKAEGLHLPEAHGAAINPVGFPLHPMKYVLGLARVAEAAGARLHGDSEVRALSRDQGRWLVETTRGAVRADKVLIATNGYSADDLPPWIEGRTLPAMSAILVTRPLSEAERQAQGWTSRRMAYDSRRLLHYFRLLPDGRFLFGMRGGLSADAAEERAIAAQVRRHFAAMFPAWAGVGIESEWNGLVCLTGSLTPYAGPVPETDGLYAAFGWHGNGVSTASLAGREVGRMMAGAEVRLPAPVATPPRRFPVPILRRQLMRLTYLLVGLAEGRPRPQGPQGQTPRGQTP